MLEQLAQQVLSNQGLSGIAILALSLAVLRLSSAYVTIRDRTEQLLISHETEAKKLIREAVQALHAASKATDRMASAVEKCKLGVNLERS